MCEFICTIPEAYLKNRQLQIAYIKTRAPQLAKIEWQDQRPFNLTNFHLNKTPYNLPYKIANKLKICEKNANNACIIAKIFKIASIICVKSNLFGNSMQK